MSRELRFVLILFGSIFGLCIVGGIVAAIFLGTTVAHMEDSSTPASRKAIAERIAPVPAGYHITSATQILYSLSATLTSPDGATDIIVQSNALPGAAAQSEQSDALAKRVFKNTVNFMLGHSCPNPVAASPDRYFVRGRTIELDVYECRNLPVRIEFGQFAGRSGPATIAVTGSLTKWDGKAVREVLGAAP